MDDLGKYCDEKIIQSLRSGRDGKINGMNVKVEDFYFFVLDFILDRIDFLKYSDKGSIGDVNFVRVENFLLFL